AGAPTSHHGETECRAYDSGWEEHGGAHLSCGECLSVHGGCEMRCYDYDTTCTATGQRQDRDSLGNITSHDETSTAVERDEYRARDMAIYQCTSQGLINCQIQRCDQNSHLTDSRTCQRGAPDVSGNITIRR
ncbi:MAG: hypothetical protein ACXWRA_01215, partial [Pseudobdellovibrionaceae bacterium]